MMVIQNKLTGEKKQVNRLEWEDSKSLYSGTRDVWDIIDEGAPVIWTVRDSDNNWIDYKLIDLEDAVTKVKGNVGKWGYRPYELSSKIKPARSISEEYLKTYNPIAQDNNPEASKSQDKREYSPAQLKFLWALWKIHNSDPLEGGPHLYLVSNILMELSLSSSNVTGKEWLQELISDGLVVGHSRNVMHAGMKSEGEVYIKKNPKLFGGFEKEYAHFVDRLNDGDFFDRVRQNDEQTEVDNSLKHALSKDDNDLGLLAAEYSIVGIIGYSSQVNREGSKNLRIVWLRDTNDQLVIFDAEKEKFEGRKFEEVGSLGFTSPIKTALQLHRYHKRGDIHESDHLTCARPISNIEKWGYEDETQEVYGEVYLYEEPGEDRVPIYLYSTNPDVKVFEPLEESEIEKETEADIIPDTPSKIDDLGRRKLMGILANKLNKMWDEWEDKPFQVMLNGEWGIGKSTMMDFLKNEMQSKKWKVVDYNAWAHQHLEDQWWLLVNKVSKEIAPSTPDIDSHKWWSFKLQNHNTLVVVVLATVFMWSVYGLADYFLLDGQDVNLYAGLIGLLGSVWVTFSGMVQHVFKRRVSTEDLARNYSEDPYKPIRERFEQLTSCNDNKVAIFIDDLDRCEIKPTISLLEGIQNLFKNSRVLYVIAADGNWITTCFNKQYGDFENLSEPGMSIGNRFLQKSFQMIVDVPKMGDEQHKQLWEKYLGVSSEPDHEDQQITAKIASSESEEEVEEALAKGPTTLEQRTQAAEKLGDILEKQKEHLLSDYIEHIPKNPRQMIRLINQFIIKYQSLAIMNSMQHVSKDALIRYIIFSLSYPDYDSEIRNGIKSIEEIGEDNQEIKDLIVADLTSEMIREFL